VTASATGAFAWRWETTFEAFAPDIPWSDLLIDH
jgi:hypothetical protein